MAPIIGGQSLLSGKTSNRAAFVGSSSPRPNTIGNPRKNTAFAAYTDDGQIGRSNDIQQGLYKGNVNHASKRNLPPPSLPNGGKITMVGSGPGDPDLLTVAAHKILTDPSILVISDRLVSPEILELIKGEIKVARKLPGCAEEAQNEVSRKVFFIH